MTKETFLEKVLEHRSALYYVSYGLLPNKEDQEDAVQECIHKALKKRETLRDDQFFKTWITRILINECYNVMRRKKREVPSEQVAVVAPYTSNYGLFESVMELEEKLRLPIILHYLEGYTTREVAKILRTPESTVKSRLAKARVMLSQMIDFEGVFV